MKKTGVLLLILGFLLLGLVGCATKSPSTNNNQGDNNAPQTTVLKFSSSLPAQGFPGVTYDYFAELVKEESNGRVEVQHHPSGTLSSDPELVDALMKGNVDMGHFMVAYVTPTIKELTPLEIPGFFTEGDKYFEFNQKTKPVVDKIFQKYGIKFLGMGYPGELVWTSSKNVGDFVKTPERMKGLTVRAPGKWDGETIKLWGGTPAAIPIGDLSAAVERGMVDLVFTGWIIIDSFKIYEMTPYVTMTGLQGAYQGIIMSDAAWKKLDAEQQAAVERATERWMEYAYKVNGELKEKFLRKLPASGAQAYFLTDAERAEFNKVTAKLREETKKTTGPEGEQLIEIISTFQ